MDSYPAKCARCDVPLEGPAEPEPESVFVCPICGTGDNLENIQREIGEYLADKTANAVGAMFERLARETDSVSVTPDHGPRKIYRFIVDYEPR